MKASDFDAVIDCPSCNGSRPSCPFCANGEFSYYARANPAEPNRSVLIYGVTADSDGGVKKMISVQRMNVLAGDQTQSPPTDDSGAVIVPADMADRMQNQLGANAPYSINDSTVVESDLPNGWPSDPDLSPQEVLGWLETRGSTALADPLRDAIDNLGL
jgi:hypothetical protein